VVMVEGLRRVSMLWLEATSANGADVASCGCSFGAGVASCGCFVSGKSLVFVIARCLEKGGAT
jgi:hypothetical protein